MTVIAHVILRGVTSQQYPAHEVYLPQRAIIAPSAAAHGS